MIVNIKVAEAIDNGIIFSLDSPELGDAVVTAGGEVGMVVNVERANSPSTVDIYHLMMLTGERLTRRADEIC